MPVLIVHGTDDEIVPVAMGEKLAALFPNAELKLVPGRHHNDLLSSEMDGLVSCIAEFAAGSACRVRFAMPGEPARN